MVEHPPAEQISDFLMGRLGEEATREVVRHLLRGCATCRASIREAWRRERHPPPGREAGRYDSAFARALDVARSRELALAHERVMAPGLLADLEDLPQEGQERRIAAEPRFRSWGLCELLIEESRGQVFAGRPGRAVELARLAVAISERLDRSRYGRELVADLQARVWAELGNCQRNDSDFAAARESFREARARLGQGSGDRAIEARIICLEASLLVDLGSWEEALAGFDRALALYRGWGSEALVARTLVQKAIPLGYLDPPAAIALLAAAEREIRRSENPRLFLCARHTRILLLADGGKSDAALLLLEESRPLYRQFHDDWNQLRLRWLEARIALGLGHLDEAESAFSQLWSFVFERRLRLELALVTLDLTAVYLAKGEMQKAWRTAGRLVPLFQSWGVHRHAMAAWLLLQRAFAAETATAGLIQEVARYLQRSWKNPELAFEPRGT
jgi:tetratricopeptide (TPR) repeat protein